MAGIRFHHVSLAGLVPVAFLLFAPGPAGQARATGLLADVPVVWYERDGDAIPKPELRSPDYWWDGVQATAVRPTARLVKPSRIIRRVGELFGGNPAPPAGNVNTLDEVPNSTWFTNRIGLFPMSADEAARGPCQSDGPSTREKWVVVRAKTEGVTPGFNIRDALGHVYVVKFDAPGYLGMTSAAGVISNRILHAAGYNVPEDNVVTFRRADLELGEGIEITLPEGGKRSMTEEDLSGILRSVTRLPDGRWLAIASKYLDGEPIGPFDYKGRRKDDPNDRVPHEQRRELRALRVFAAWLNHFDTKQANTLDMYVEEGGRRFVRHYLIDFASTIGAGGDGPSPLHGFEGAFDVSAIFSRAVTAGLYEDPWRRLERPAGLDEVGFFESYQFAPDTYKPSWPNSSFAEMTDRDGYWGAKIISAFTDGHIEAIVREGRYQNQDAANYVARMLRERRDKIARFWFDRVPPLDFFSHRDGVLRFRDLGAERGVYPGFPVRYRVRAAAVTALRRPARWTGWVVVTRPEIDLKEDPIRRVIDEAAKPRYPFVAIRLQVDRGDGWSRPVTTYVARASGRVVAVSR